MFLWNFLNIVTNLSTHNQGKEHATMILETVHNSLRKRFIYIYSTIYFYISSFFYRNPNGLAIDFWPSLELRLIIVN